MLKTKLSQRLKHPNGHTLCDIRLRPVLRRSDYGVANARIRTRASICLVEIRTRDTTDVNRKRFDAPLSRIALPRRRERTELTLHLAARHTCLIASDEYSHTTNIKAWDPGDIESKRLQTLIVYDKKDGVRHLE